jgi:hypothetical protein
MGGAGKANGHRAGAGVKGAGSARPGGQSRGGWREAGGAGGCWRGRSGDDWGKRARGVRPHATLTPPRSSRAARRPPWSTDVGSGMRESLGGAAGQRARRPSRGVDPRAGVAWGVAASPAAPRAARQRSAPTPTAPRAQRGGTTTNPRPRVPTDVPAPPPRRHRPGGRESGSRFRLATAAARCAAAATRAPRRARTHRSRTTVGGQEGTQRSRVRGCEVWRGRRAPPSSGGGWGARGCVGEGKGRSRGEGCELIVVAHSVQGATAAPPTRSPPLLCAPGAADVRVSVRGGRSGSAPRRQLLLRRRRRRRRGRVSPPDSPRTLARA